MEKVPSEGLRLRLPQALTDINPRTTHLCAIGVFGVYGAGFERAREASAALCRWSKARGHWPCLSWATPRFSLIGSQYPIIRLTPLVISVNHDDNRGAYNIGAGTLPNRTRGPQLDGGHQEGGGAHNIMWPWALVREGELLAGVWDCVLPCLPLPRPPAPHADRDDGGPKGAHGRRGNHLQQCHVGP